MNSKEYQLVTYEIFGGEVNDAFTTDVFINVDDHTSDAAINRRLTMQGCVNTRGTTWDGGFPYTLYGTNKRNGRPVAELRPVKPEPCHVIAT